MLPALILLYLAPFGFSGLDFPKLGGGTSVFLNLILQKYKQKNPDKDDAGRFNDLIIALIGYVKETNQLKQFLTNELFYDEFILFVNSQYDALQEFFLKGAYPKMIDAMNRIWWLFIS